MMLLDVRGMWHAMMWQSLLSSGACEWHWHIDCGFYLVKCLFQACFGAVLDAGSVLCVVGPLSWGLQSWHGPCSMLNAQNNQNSFHEHCIGEVLGTALTPVMMRADRREHRCGIANCELLSYMPQKAKKKNSIRSNAILNKVKQ